jgi:hypothetical protein
MRDFINSLRWILVLPLTFAGIAVGFFGIVAGSGLLSFVGLIIVAVATYVVAPDD